MAAANSEHGWTDPLSGWLIARIDASSPAGAERRAAYARLEGWVGIVLNAVLTAAKLAIGLSIGSLALVADAVHTLADSLTSAVLIIGARIAQRPADREHPYGHGRAEIVAAVVIAVLLGVAAVEFFKSSVARLLHPEPVHASIAALVAVVGFAVVKEWNARLALGLAARSGSMAIRADAWHHRSDVFATLLVAVGIAGAHYGLYVLDPAMGVAVSAAIGLTAFGLARQSIDPLLGTAPSAAEIKAIAATALEVDGVEGAHDIVVHRYGELRVVTLHIETSATSSVLSAHELADQVQQRIGEGQGGHVVVHVDPIDRHHPRYQAVRQAVGELLAAEPRVHSYHDLRVVGDARTPVVEVGIEGEPAELSDADVDEIRGHIQRVTGAARVAVELRPMFAYGPDGEGAISDPGEGDAAPDSGEKARARSDKDE